MTCITGFTLQQSFDFDFDYKSDYEIENGTFNQETNVPSSVPGAGYLSAPFVFLFNWISFLLIQKIFLEQTLSDLLPT